MSIKVFVVDDSAVVRQTLMHLLQGDPSIELVGTAPNPLIAAPAIRKPGAGRAAGWTSKCPAWTV